MNPRKAKWVETTARKSPRPAEAEPLVALYHRVSSVKQRDEQTILRQQSITRDLFFKNFKDERCLVAEVNDEAFNFEAIEPDRAFFKTLIPLIVAGECNTVIVSGEDRIFRGNSAAVRGHVTDVFRKYGVRIVTPGGTTAYDSRQTTTRLVNSITQELGAISKLETVKTLYSGRRRRLQEDDAWRLSVWPYGYRLVVLGGKRKSYAYEVVEEEAKVVRDIFALYAGRKTEFLPAADRPLGSNSIADLLNRLGIGRDQWKSSLPPGVQAQTRSTFDHQSIRRMLANETYTGRLTVVFKPTEKVPGFGDEAAVKRLTVPAIVPDDLFVAASEVHEQRRLRILDERSPRRDTNWLHGLVECPECGRPMDGIVASNGMRYYRCAASSKDKPHGMLRADDAEGLLEAELSNVLTGSLDFKRLLRHFEARDTNDPVGEARKELGLVNQQLEDLNKQLKRLTESFVKGVIDDESLYLEMKKDLADKIQFAKLCHENLTRKIASAAGASSVAPGIQVLKEAFVQAMEHEDERKRILHAFVKVAVDRVQVVRGAPPDLSTLDLEAIKALYLAGRVTAKAVRDHLGWRPKKLIDSWGKCGRKAAIDYDLKVWWREP